mmetsp:Transcript_69635/g.201885  ORF Transcript_69635/g.201885 Transcript_69635/m.201885 type:complete len:238 (-) Transcript_69635:312-1025(-)
MISPSTSTLHMASAMRSDDTRPTTTSVVVKCAFSRRRKSTVTSVKPSSTRATRASAPASTRAMARSKPRPSPVSSTSTDTAAATISCPLGSLVASAFCSMRFWSPRQIRATSSLSLLTIGNLPTLRSCMTAEASRCVTGSEAVTMSVTMTLVTGSRFAASGSLTASKSRRETRPINLPPMRPFSVTGRQLQPTSFIAFRALTREHRGPTTRGASMNAVSWSFTRLTMAHCSSRLWSE